MKVRYRLIRRGSRGDMFYCVDSATEKRTSLKTSDEESARRLVAAKNEVERQPVLNLQIARAYLMGSDSGISSRTWRDAIERLTAMKQAANRERWKRAANDKAFALLLPLVITETRAEILLKVLQLGCVSTNIYLRRLHNFCLDMNWLPWPLIPKRQWPAIRFKEKRAITTDEHRKIVEREKNPERKAFYQLAWHLGASQSDLANLQVLGASPALNDDSAKACRPYALFFLFTTSIALGKPEVADLVIKALGAKIPLAIRLGFHIEGASLNERSKLLNKLEKHTMDILRESKSSDHQARLLIRAPIIKDKPQKTFRHQREETH